MDQKYDNEDKFVELAEELEKTPVSDKHWSAIQDIIRNLRESEYHDFKNEKFAAPKMQMIADFRAIDREDVAQRVMNGDFDQ